MIDKPVVIRPEDLWTVEEIQALSMKKIGDTDWNPQCHWTVIDIKGNLIPHPERPDSK